MQLRFGLAYFFSMISGSVFSHFAAVFFASEGYTLLQIGWFTAMASLALLLAQPVFGYLSDRLNAIKVLTLSCCTASLPLVCGAYFGRQRPLVLAACFVLHTVALRTACTLIDSWVSALNYDLNFQGNKTINYSAVRGMASLGMAASGLSISLLLSWWGFSAVFIMQAVAMCLCIMALWIIPNTDIKLAHAQQTKPGGAPSDPPFRKPLFWCVVIPIVILFIGHNADATYLPLLFLSSGGSTGGVGAIVFIQAISEVAVLFIYAKLRKRFSCCALLLAAIILYTLRYTLLFATHSPHLFYFFQIMQGTAFGVLIPSFVELVTRIAGQGHVATAISASMALMFGGGSVLGNLIGGQISQNFGVRAVYILTASAGLIACAIYLLVIVQAGKRKWDELNLQMPRNG